MYCTDRYITHFGPLKLLPKSSDICVGNITIVKWTAERGASEKTKFILSRGFWCYRSVDSCCNRLVYGSVNKLEWVPMFRRRKTPHFSEYPEDGGRTVLWYVALTLGYVVL